MMYTRSLLTVSVLTLLTFSVLAQSDTLPLSGQLAAKGVGINQPELFDQYMVTMPGLGSNARELLMEQSVKPYLMPPRRREYAGSANSYALAACLEFYANFDQNFKINLSPDYISLNLPQDNIEDALFFLINNGTVNAAIMPYGASSIPSAVRATQKYTVLNYLHLYWKDTRGRQKTFETKKALMRGNPVIVQILMPADLSAWKDQKWWDSSAQRPTQLQTFLVVGYHEGDEAFELQGSLGSGWADNGYIWVRYADFEKYAQDGYVLVPRDAYDHDGR
ncbi:MAG: hypothetical protein KDC43_13220 [Saprospiraceae bacterium]|nr:hypothetical protein [Saprospiraceae bacterium]MCB0624837.1 hypothetical protein [Saprospiraceae bacterium]MCB0679084.1 hypothetical protein [Saprospiraceae bacterium]MCB0680067.1 hypothetical protein [Saprospiraceae bacterium]